MKIICSRENLQNGIQTVNKAVSLKSPMPILSGILLSAYNDKLVLTATDLEIGIECTVPVSVIEEGTIVVPARYISEIVRKLPDIKIELEDDREKQTLFIKYGQSSFNISCFNPDEFPSLPEIEEKILIEVDEDNLKQMIKQVSYAISNDDTKPVFTGVLMEVENNQLRLIASDTHRLAYRSLNLEKVFEEKFNVIIPGKTLNELSRILGTEKRIVKIILADNQISFQIEEVNIISRLLNGQFPDYHYVIPEECQSKIMLKTNDLHQAIERAVLLVREGSIGVKLSIDNDLLTLNASNEVGKIYEELPIYSEGEALTISFNAKYLNDLLKVVDEEDICFEFNGALGPGVIKFIDKDNFLSLVLPIRLT